MHHDLTVVFRPGQQIHVSADTTMTADEGRRWLDDQFLAFDCTPLRASGKVLVADKLLAVAGEAGQAHFAADPAWATQFVQAAGAATGRPLIRVDIEAASVTF